MINELFFGILGGIGCSLSLASLVASIKKYSSDKKILREKKKELIRLQIQRDKAMLELEKLQQKQLLELIKLQKELNKSSISSEMISDNMEMKKMLEELKKQKDSLNE